MKAGDIVRIANVPVLGHVPQYRPLRVVDGGEKVASAPDTDLLDLASEREPQSVLAEAFRNLRTSLLLASPDHPPRCIAVTSCEPQDGKSTVSCNLAVVLTQLGRKVLLVDADLRRPRIHRALGLDNDTGLSSVLSGNALPADVMHPTHITRLTVAPSGPIPPNPSELLGSAGLASFLSFATEQAGFDHVIFDSPPVLSVTDPVVLATATDATILVVRQAKTARDSLSHAVDILRKSRVKLAGTVLNAVSEESGPFHYSHYRYGLAEGGGSEAATPRSRTQRWRMRRGKRGAGGA